MKSLHEIGVRFQTDKSTSHRYLDLYQLLFRDIEAQLEQRILEIGIQFGNSLKTWQDYFDFPIITGIDSIDNGVYIDRVEIIIADAYTLETVQRFEDREFDICIDDGSHEPEHQAFTVREYSQLLSLNGILIIEDVGSKEFIPQLVAQVPPGFTYTAVDITEAINTAPDSRLFIVYRK